MNTPINTDKVNKIQKIITLLDTTIKMLNSLISLKNTIKKEVFPEKDKKEENNNNQNNTSGQQNNNQISSIIKSDSFVNYIKNVKKEK